MAPASKGAKITKRQHYEQIQKTTGTPQKELVLPELAPGARLLWSWYRELQTGERLTWQEIRAWMLLTRNDITPEIAQALRNLSFIQHNALNQ